MILKSQTNDARNKALIGIALSPTVKHGQAARNFVFILDTCPTHTHLKHTKKHVGHAIWRVQ